ncbi:ABC transporter permease [Tessaracoccus sp. G1721]
MTWLTNNWEQVVELSFGHLLLTVPAVAVSLLVALPLGWLAHRRPRVGGPVLATATLLYAVPALPLLIVIPVVFGTPLRSSATMIVALSIYGVALLVRSVTDGFGSVDRQVRDAAVAIGHSPSGVLWRVDLPLATPVILAGLRVATVSTVGLVTIGALIGVPSLGTLLTDGFQRGIVAEVATGVVMTVALALALDGLLILAGRALTPWTRATSHSRDPVLLEVRR